MEKWIALIPFVLGALVAALGVFFLRGAWFMRGVNRQIAEQGVDTQAEVTDHRSLTAARGDARTYYLTATYSVPAAGGPPRTFTRESEVSAEDYERLNPGDKVSVRYLPAAPGEMTLHSGVHDQSVQGFLAPGLAALLLGGGLMLLAVWVWLR